MDLDRAVSELTELVEQYVPEKKKKRFLYYVNVLKRKELDAFFEEEKKKNEESYERFRKTFASYFSIEPANYGIYGNNCFRGHDAKLLKDLDEYPKDTKLDVLIWYPEEENIIVFAWNNIMTKDGHAEQLLLNEKKIPY